MWGGAFSPFFHERDEMEEMLQSERLTEHLCVNPNLYQNKTGLHVAAIIHLCFAQFRADYMMAAFVTDIREGEKHIRNTDDCVFMSYNLI